jgi:mxaJ protein
MRFRVQFALAALAAAASGLLSGCTSTQASAEPSAQISALRVCSDPNNLPFSDAHQKGFENKIAEIIGADMQLPVQYAWRVQRSRGYINKTLGSHSCDVLLGVPEGMPQTLTTHPYYRSSYVFVWRKERGLNITSFDDPALRHLKIGVQRFDEDYAPPAIALVKRNLLPNIVGFGVHDDYSKPEPAADIMRALDGRKIDVAVVWGPLAGYYARQHGNHFAIVPVSPQVDPPGLPFAYDIAMGVRVNDLALRDRVQEALDHHEAEINRVLAQYGVPRVAGTAQGGMQ